MTPKQTEIADRLHAKIKNAQTPIEQDQAISRYDRYLATCFKRQKLDGHARSHHQPADTPQEIGSGPLGIHIEGNMGSGKSCMAAFIGAALTKLGHTVSIFDGDHRLKVPSEEEAQVPDNPMKISIHTDQS